MKAIRFSASAAAALRKMPTGLRDDFLGEIAAIASEETSPESLTGKAASLKRIKYNGWRALLSVSDDAVFVERLSPRSLAYRGLSPRRQ